MPHHFPIPEVIKLADVSVSLSANYQYEGELFGPRLGQSFPLTIAIIADALRWHYESFPPIPIEDAVGSITVTDIGNPGDTIEVLVNDIEYGLISLGTYVRQPGDTDLNILASNIALALGGTVIPCGSGPQELTTESGNNLITENNQNLIT